MGIAHNVCHPNWKLDASKRHRQRASQKCAWAKRNSILMLDALVHRRRPYDSGYIERSSIPAPYNNKSAIRRCALHPCMRPVFHGCCRCRCWRFHVVSFASRHIVIGAARSTRRIMPIISVLRNQLNAFSTSTISHLIRVHGFASILWTLRHPLETI